MRVRPLAAIVLLSGFGTFSGCLTARDSAVPEENGFWTREGHACTRVIASPVLALWGLATMGEEFCVGCWEVVSGQEYTGIARPMDLLDRDGTRPAPPPPEEESSADALSAFGKESDAALCEACDARDWRRTAARCRLLLARSKTPFEKAMRGMQLAMANWNANDRTGSVIAMDTVVAACTAIGEESRAMAQEIRAEFRSDKTADSFSASDLTRLRGRRKMLAETILRELSRSGRALKLH